MSELHCTNNHSFTVPNRLRVLPWCPVCENVNAEKTLLKVLTLMGQSPSKKYVIPCIPGLTFTFYLWYNNKKVLIQFDGRDLFEYAEWSVGNMDAWKRSQLTERVKTYVGIEEGYKIIRISYD